ILILDGEKVKVMNFGVPTPMGSVLGIPEFLSPEQADGKQVDQRSSIYSLGAVLYYMVTGEVVVTGEPEAGLKAHVQMPVPGPAMRTPGVTVPPEVERLLLKTLEKQSSKRHLTLRQLVSELEAIANGTAPPVVATPGPSIKRISGPQPPVMGASASA